MAGGDGAGDAATMPATMPVKESEGRGRRGGDPGMATNSFTAMPSRYWGDEQADADGVDGQESGA
jgi:hypothetical protein